MSIKGSRLPLPSRASATSLPVTASAHPSQVPPFCMAPVSKTLRHSRCTFHHEVRYESADGMRASHLNSFWRLPVYSCAAAWAKKCSKPMPCPDGSGIAGLAIRTTSRHPQGRCPCARVGYGGPTHRWCTGGVHHRGARLMRKRSPATAGSPTKSLLLLRGKIQTRITDFYKPVKG
jgi:hypothetical protein